MELGTGNWHWDLVLGLELGTRNSDLVLDLELGTVNWNFKLELGRNYNSDFGTECLQRAPPLRLELGICNWNCEFGD